MNENSPRRPTEMEIYEVESLKKKIFKILKGRDIAVSLYVLEKLIINALLNYPKKEWAISSSEIMFKEMKKRIEECDKWSGI